MKKAKRTFKTMYRIFEITNEGHFVTPKFDNGDSIFDQFCGYESIKEVKFRKTWAMNPVERIHREGKVDGYNRNLAKKEWMEEWEEDNEEQDKDNE